MFDFAWSELALIGVVALVAIGPKDMPVAIKSVANVIKKARRMAGEFQTDVDDLMKEADLTEMRQSLNELRSLNPRGMMERAIDPDGALRGGLGVATPPSATYVGVHPEHAIADPAPAEFGYGVPSYGVPGMPAFVPPPDHLRPDLDAAPAFIPPGAVAAERALRAAPPFIPPAFAATAEH